MQSQAYYHLIEHPVRARDMASQLYRDPSKTEIEEFNHVNDLTDPHSMLYPGRFVCAPSLDGSSEAGRAGMQEIGKAINFASRTLPTNVGISTFNKNQDLLKKLVAYNETAKPVLQPIGTYFDLFDEQIKLLAKNLDDIRALYQDGLRETKNLKTPAFLYARKALRSKVKRNLEVLALPSSIKKTSLPSARDIERISTKSLLKNAFKTRGNPLEIKEISKSLSKINSTTSKMTKASSFFKALDVGAVAVQTYNAFVDEGQEKGLRAIGAKFGGAALGMAAGEAAVAQLALVAVTGPLGLVGLGIGIVAIAGLSYAVGEVGEYGVGQFIDNVNLLMDGAINWMVEP